MYKKLIIVTILLISFNEIVTQNPLVYKDWVVFTFSTNFDGTFYFKDVKLESGKYYNPPDKNEELDLENISKLTFDLKNKATFGACGRANAFIGVEGSFKIYNNNNIEVSKIYFDVPYSGDNKLEITNYTSKSKFVCLFTNENYPKSGPLKEIGVQCFKILSS